MKRLAWLFVERVLFDPTLFCVAVGLLFLWLAHAMPPPLPD